MVLVYIVRSGDLLSRMYPGDGNGMRNVAQVFRAVNPITGEYKSTRDDDSLMSPLKNAGYLRYCIEASSKKHCVCVPEASDKQCEPLIIRMT